jgi:hypothetical protein
MGISIHFFLFYASHGEKSIEIKFFCGAMDSRCCGGKGQSYDVSEIRNMRKKARANPCLAMLRSQNAAYF